MNLSMGKMETWGANDPKDPLAEYFVKKIEGVNPFDIPLMDLHPTCKNMKMRDNRIAKRIDWFFVNECLLQGFPIIKQWVVEGGDFDHFPIFLEFKGGKKNLLCVNI